MKSHPLNCDIAILEQIDNVRIVKKNGLISLADQFRTYCGAAYKSPALSSLAQSFDYETDGYGLLVAGPALPERIAVADYTEENMAAIRQGYLNEEDRLSFAPLADDLKPFESRWKNLFNNFAREVRPLMGLKFEVRLQCVQFSKEDFHFDKGVVIGILPLGEERESTLMQTPDGQTIHSENGTFIVTTPRLYHSAPPSKIPRAALMATRYGKDIF